MAKGNEGGMGSGFIKGKDDYIKEQKKGYGDNVRIIPCKIIPVTDDHPPPKRPKGEGNGGRK